jgi:GNAT superfamily N-acetyltransferase
VPQPQNGDFQIQIKIEKYYEFDWIKSVHGFVRMPDQNQKDAVADSNADSGFSSKTAEEEFFEDSEDFDKDTDSELNENMIGRCNALLIRNHRINFYDDMEGPSRETSALAYELFDRYGRLRLEFKDHPIKKGSGIWRDGLDIGPILLIEEIHIEKPYRRRSIGQKVVLAVLEEMRSKSEPFVALTQPGVIRRDYGKLKENLTDEESKWFFAEELRVSIAFWRAVGFRRIGSSSWFGLASAVDHPCHTLSASEDYDPPMSSNLFYPAMDSLLADIATMEDSESLERAKQAFRDAPIPPNRTCDPLMDLLLIDMVIKDDKECVEKLEQAFEHVSINDPRCEARNNNGNTVLHIAAIKIKPKTVKWIMERITQLTSTRNWEQETPLEALQSHLETERTRLGSNSLSLNVPVSDRFEGFTKEMVVCLCLLSGQTNLSSIAFQRLTFGCTCGQCIQGFLSPRMRYALLCQAEVQHDLLLHEIDYESGNDFVESNEHVLRHVSHPSRENMKTNKSMRQGFANLCDHFATCLRDNKLPITTNILDALRNAGEWPPTSRNFLQRGGTVESVGSMMFELAMHQDELAGDGEHLEVFREEIEVFPECRNDHEFGFVSGMCGYKRVSNIRYV